MSNLSDKEIDRLSREAADSYEPDPGSLSWSRLEQLLTKQMPERPPDGFRFGRISPYIWGPAVILLTGISFYLVKNKFYSADSTQTSKTVNQQMIPSSSADTHKSEGNALLADSSSVNAVLPAPPSESGSAGNPALIKKESGKNDVGKDTPASGGSLPVGISNLSNTASAKIKSGKTGRDRKNNTSSVLTGAGIIGSGKYQAASDQSNTVPGKTDELTAASGTAASRVPSSLPPLAYTGYSKGIVKGNDSLLIRANAANTVVPPRTMHINRSLNIGFAFGPDYANAGGIANNQLSNNVGITAGYYLTGKISLNTGIFYSNKFFWSPGYGPAIPWQTGNNPATTAYAAPTIEYVNGSINMYEVPLSLRYDFAQTGKSKFFASAGLSSYFIINQSYIYFYHSGYRASAWRRTDNSQENHWFGVSNFSAGIETDIGKGFSFQAEPFLKIPLTQMGLEKLKIDSYGFLISFRYTPVLSRSKK